MLFSHFPATLSLACMLCMVATGCGPSTAQKKQQALKQQRLLQEQQEALRQLLALQQRAQQQSAAPTTTAPPPPVRAAVASASPSCPNFRGQFLYPGDTVTIEQQGCSILVFHHQGRTAVTVVLDGTPHKLPGDAGHSIVRTSLWDRNTVHIEDKVYTPTGEYSEHVVRDLGVDAQGQMVIRTEVHAIIGGKEVMEGNPKLVVAPRIGS